VSYSYLIILQSFKLIALLFLKLLKKFDAVGLLGPQAQVGLRMFNRAIMACHLL